MIAKRLEELEAWQLAAEVRRAVILLTETGSAARDFKFRDQIRDAASSATRNVAEGFGRFRPKEFAHFMEYSIASSMETRDLILDGLQRKYFTAAKTSNAQTLVRRSLQVSRGLLRYLKRCKGDGPWNRSE